MTAPDPCDRSCPLFDACHPGGDAGSCADHCDGTPAAPADLGEALAAFEREAVCGVCDTGRYRMRYFSWGQGPPLVWVHGVCDSSRSFLLPVRRMTAHFRCVAYDLPAGDGDGAVLRRYTHDDLVADLFALLDHLGLARSYLLGSSFGATVVLRALHRAPGRLPRAVLQGAMARRPLRRAERALAWVGRWLPGRADRLPLRGKVLRASQGPFFASRPEEVWRYFLEVTGRTPVRAFAWQARVLHRLDLRPILPEVRQPVLLVSGEYDRVVPHRHGDELLAGLPSAGRVVLGGCGHTPSYTHPEVYAEVVRRFFTPPPEPAVADPRAREAGS
jgi:pimeloyl-ACP methyl ester carboxylesterase